MAGTYRSYGSSADVARGVSRLMLDLGHAPLCEFVLASGRRLDVAAVSADGSLVGVEIKVSVEDLRGDRKWPEYLDYCEQYFFAVPEGFPESHLPAEHGLIVADRFGGAILRPSQALKVSAARRKATLIRFARCAAERFARQGLLPPET
jgi:hypothetical protein